MAIFSPADDNDWTARAERTLDSKNRTYTKQNRTEQHCNNNQLLGVTQSEEKLKISYSFALVNKKKIYLDIPIFW